MSSFRHSELLNNIPGFGKWAWLNINPDNCFIYIYIYMYIYIAGWLITAPIKFVNSNSANSRLWCFLRKKTFATAIVNMFCKSSLINHKCWICLLIFTFVSTSEASYSVLSVSLALGILSTPKVLQTISLHYWY